MNADYNEVAVFVNREKEVDKMGEIKFLIHENIFFRCVNN